MRVAFKTLSLCLSLLVASWALNGCSKDNPTGKGSLTFSADTLTFDTVFTTLGSTTRFFKVRNPQSKTLSIANIKLLQLEGKQFRINVDGVSGVEFKNVEIPAHDSIYVLVEVTVNPNSANNPFVITDQVQFTTEGAVQQVVLEALGQNAHYHINDSATASIPARWTNDKPHIIVSRNGGVALYQVKQNGMLTIEPHCQIYMGPNALITVDGQLDAVANSVSDSIKFQYIRHDGGYQDRPGQWIGISYSRTATINMRHCIINQSTIGVSDEHILNVLFNRRITTSNINTYGSSPVPSVTIEKSVIKNASLACVFALGTKLVLTNSLLYNAGSYLLLLGLGGDHTINHCTLVNVGNDHKGESVALTYGLTDIDSKTYVTANNTTARITNTVIYGSLENEIKLVNGFGSVYTFGYSWLKNNRDTLLAYTPAADSCIYGGRNDDPQFRYPYLQYQYMPDSSSVLNRSGIANGITNDLYDYPRPGRPSRGAIEYH